MAVCKNQVREIAVFSNQDALLLDSLNYQSKIARGWVIERGADHVMSSAREQPRDEQANMNVEQEPQAALACPTAA